MTAGPERSKESLHLTHELNRALRFDIDIPNAGAARGCTLISIARSPYDRRPDIYVLLGIPLFQQHPRQNDHVMVASGDCPPNTCVAAHVRPCIGPFPKHFRYSWRSPVSDSLTTLRNVSISPSHARRLFYNDRQRSRPYSP